MRTSAHRILVALIAGMVMLGIGGAAQAQPADGTDTGSVQARPDLTATQIDKLDHRVSITLDKTSGGVRTGVNEVTWPERGVALTLAVPGQMQTASQYDCAYENVCLYSGRNFTGDRLVFWKCGTEKLRHYNFTNRTSSWVNNQTYKTYSELRYWTGTKSKKMTGTKARKAQTFSGEWDNKADFLMVC